MEERNNFLLSVIIPCYNSEKNLESCLQSVLSNKGDYFEVIVVDDGSTDNTGKIIKTFSISDRRIKYFKKTNGGVSSARNYGISKAKGEYFLFLDSDDCLPKNVLSIYKKSILEKQNVDIFFGKTEYKTTIGYKKRDFSSDIKKDVELSGEEYIEIIKHYINRDGIQYSSLSKAFSSKLIRQNNIHFNENVSFCEDVLFNIDFFSLASVACARDSFVYTVHLCNNNGSLTHSYNRNQIEAIEKTYFGFLSLREKILFGSNLSLYDIDNRFVFELLDVMFRLYSNKYSNLTKKIKKAEIKKILNNEILSRNFKLYKKKKNFLNHSFPEKLFKKFYFNKTICYFILLLYYFIRKIF